MNVLELQRALYRVGFDPGGLDGTIGPKTRAAIAAFASDRCLSSFDAADPASSLGQVEAELAHELEALPPFVEARNYTRNGMADVRLIVIHTAEAPEIHREATNVANFFAMQPADPQKGSSAHYVVDDAAVVQCVLECDRAWHAANGYANAHGIGIEHAGYASQSPDDWRDDYSKAVLANSAKLVAGLCTRFHIPPVKLSVAELAAGARGICGHVDVTNAFNGGRGHTDPGPSFPWDAYLEQVRASAT